MSAAPGPTAFESEGFVEVPGGRVWYGRLDGPPRGGLPLIVAHGGPGTPHDYLEVLAALADERPVIFYDQLGCGRSPAAGDPELWRRERFVEELGVLHGALVPGPVHLFGHSWGTILCTSYALERGDGVASLALQSPCLDIPRLKADIGRLVGELPEGIQRTIAAFDAGEASEGAYRAACMSFFLEHVCRVYPFPEALERALARRNAATYRRMWGPSELAVTGNLRDFDCTDRLAELAQPVLLLCGRHDECTPEATGRLAPLLPASELLVLEQGSHFLSLEQPERFVEAVRGFLRRAERRREVLPC
ncbi:MAG: proline iminopeptidase-family hydrolase [Planctomycetota bacterium]